MWQIHVIDDYKNLDPDIWRTVAEDRSVFQDFYWYKNVQHPGQLRLICASENGTIKSILPVLIIDRPCYYYHNPRDVLTGECEWFLSPKVEEEARELRKENWFPAAVTLSPFGYRGGIIHKDCANIPDDILHGIIQEARKLFTALGIKLAAYYYLNQRSDQRWMETLRKAGIKSWFAGADCNLNIHWSSFEDYFNSFRSRRRSRMKTEYFKSKSETGIKWSKWSGQNSFDQNVRSQVAHLFSNNERKYNGLGKTHDIYLNMLNNPADNCFLLTGEKNLTIRSALLVFKKGNVLYPKFYGDLGVRHDYFYLTFYRLIKEAISDGIRRIEFGGGNHKAKLLRGTDLRPLYMGLDIFDQRLKTKLSNYLPLYEESKRIYFSELVRNYSARVRSPISYTENNILSNASISGQYSNVN